MAENTKNSPASSDDNGYEKNDINIAKVLIYGVFGVIILIAVIIFTWDYFTSVKENLVPGTTLKPPSASLRELRARETEVLTSYKLLDESKGIYRIPIERAMGLVADEAYQPQIKNNPQ